MNFRRHILRPGRAVVTLAGVGVACAALAGDAIRFSKPAIAIAAPPKAESDLPEVRERGLDFSDPSFEPAIAVPPPRPVSPMMRQEPRDVERDSTHPLLRTPAMFTDPAEEKARKDALRDRNNPFAPAQEKKSAASPFTKDTSAQMRSDQSRSLAPVTELDWQPGESSKGRNEARRGGPGAGQYQARGEENQFGPDNGRATPFFDASSARPQEKLSSSQLQRRTDFEQLLNPNAGPGGQGPNSLQPVINAADAKSAGLAMPTVGGSGFDPRAADPMSTLNQQRERLRGPVIEDINKRYNPLPATGPGSPGYGNQPQGPRPPVSREFPSRKF